MNGKRCPGCRTRISIWSTLCRRCEAVETEPCRPITRTVKRSEYVNVYCIASYLPGAAIKFGISEDVASRLGAIQAHSPLRLRLVGSVRAKRTLEGRILRHLDHAHAWGEWFHATDSVLAFSRHFELGTWDAMLAELGIRHTAAILEPTACVLQVDEAIAKRFSSA